MIDDDYIDDEYLDDAFDDSDTQGKESEKGKFSKFLVLTVLSSVAPEKVALVAPVAEKVVAPLVKDEGGQISDNDDLNFELASDDYGDDQQE